MSQKIFTDESLETLVDEIKLYVNNAVSTKANASHSHSISNVTNLQSTLDGKAAKSHTHTVANISDLTATAAELNYMDGVTSNVQTQLDGKAASSHNHSATNITSGTLSSDRLPTVPISKGGTGATTAAAALTNLGITATSTELNYVDGVTSNIQTQLNGKASSSHTHNTTYIPDTRDDNQTPAWYITNYPKQVITEFKSVNTIGLSGTTYCELTTYVQWANNSGGYPSQETIINGRIYTRYGISDDKWSDWKTNIDSDNISSQSVATAASCTGNSATTTKLQTARTIGLGTGATGTATSFNGAANITIPVTDIKESYLSWGGKNLSGGVTPIDAACSNIHSANRFAFAKAAGITIEYSTNGSTYSTYSTTDSAKVNLVSGNGSAYYIGARSSSTTVNDKLRITLDATNMGLYTRLRKILINITTNYATGSNVIIEKAMKGSETTFSTVGTYQISGWSGWNSIPIEVAFGGGSTQTYNVAKLRLTFGITGVNSSQTSNALTIMDIIGIGDTYWSYPSTMAKTGHIYSYDSSQNTTFPANVTATTFVGALNGNAATATNVAWSGVTSKPSYYDAKAIKGITRSGTTFTYTCMDGTTGTFTQQDNNTTYNVVTTSANGLMSASDKVKLNSMELATIAEVKTYLGI